MSEEVCVSKPDAAREPSEAVVMAVAERKGVGPTEVPPLHDVIDPDALDDVFRGRRSGRVTFEYAGYEVTVSGRRDVQMTEREP